MSGAFTTQKQAAAVAAAAAPAKPRKAGQVKKQPPAPAAGAAAKQEEKKTVVKKATTPAHITARPIVPRDIILSTPEFVHTDLINESHPQPFVILIQQFPPPEKIDADATVSGNIQ